MNRFSPHRSTRWLTGATAGLVAFTGGETLRAAPWVEVSGLPLERAATLRAFSSGFDHVLGTSLDLTIEAARPAEARECERQILGEIERLRRMLSPYDAQSELSRVRAGGPVESPELEELLAAYATWEERTEGLIALNLGGVVAAWREAEHTGRRPTRAQLAEAARQPRAFNVDALGKGFIIDRAVAVGRRLAAGGLINLGGDLRAWGETAWPIGIADPRNPADNAAPRARFTLREAAAATSGGYARGFVVGTERFSHLIDPRTLEPIATGGSATVIAQDSVTANALSTAASIGGIARGAQLGATHGAVGHLLIAADGEIAQTGAITLAPAATSPEPPAAETNWPAGYQVAVRVALKKIDEPRFRRPYVVVWVEDDKGKVVRTMTLWGERERYHADLTEWWGKMAGDQKPPQTMTRATRPPGVYTIAWNGQNEFGKPVPAGVYTVCLEIHREHGNHVMEETKVTCGREPFETTLRETLESDVSTVKYGPVPKP